MKRVLVLWVVLMYLTLSACQTNSNPKDVNHSENPKNISSTEDPQKQIDEKVPAKQEQWNLLLVNARYPLPEDFNVPKLTQLKNGQAVDSRIYEDLQHMMDDARAAGVSPLICSSYRSVDRQTSLFNDKLGREKETGKGEEEAKAAAAMAVAVPGTSEHHTGLAVDIVDVNNQNLTDEQENTQAQKWLMANCHKYGFILRYPKDKVGITGIIYEPWHYRYVGKEAAKEITEQGICLEEYLGVS